MTDARRLLAVLLVKKFGPLCERCLAHHARLTLSETAAILGRLRASICIRFEHAKCPGCDQFTQLFSLGKPHDDATDRA